MIKVRILVLAMVMSVTGLAAAQPELVIEDLGDGVLSLTEANEGHVWGAYGECGWTEDDGVVPDSENFGGPPNYPQRDGGDDSIWTFAERGEAAILNLNGLPDGQEEVLIAIFDEDFGYACITVADYVLAGPNFSLNVEGSTFAEEGGSITLSANDDMMAPFQWKKDGGDIGGATSATFALASTVEADTGVYTLVFDDGEAKATQTSNPVAIAIFPPNSLPVTSLLGLGLLAVTSVLAGGTILARKKK